MPKPTKWLAQNSDHVIRVMSAVSTPATTTLALQPPAPRIRLREQVSALPNFQQRKQEFRQNILDPILMLKELADSSPKGQDVHLFDDLVFKGSNQLPYILQLSQGLSVSNSLTFLQTQQSMVGFVRGNPSFYTNYNGTTLTQDALIDCINRALSTIESDMAVVPGIQAQSNLVRELYSRAWTLALTMRVDSTLTQPNYGVTRILDAMSENYLTESGCIQGRVNRVFIAYAGMLTALGF